MAELLLEPPRVLLATQPDLEIVFLCIFLCIYFLCIIFSPIPRLAESFSPGTLLKNPGVFVYLTLSLTKISLNIANPFVSLITRESKVIVTSRGTSARLLYLPRMRFLSSLFRLLWFTGSPAEPDPPCNVTRCLGCLVIQMSRCLTRPELKNSIKTHFGWILVSSLPLSQLRWMRHIFIVLLFFIVLCSFKISSGRGLYLSVLVRLLLVPSSHWWQECCHLPHKECITPLIMVRIGANSEVYPGILISVGLLIGCLLR